MGESCTQDEKEQPCKRSLAQDATQPATHPRVYACQIHARASGQVQATSPATHVVGAGRAARTGCALSKGLSTTGAAANAGTAVAGTTVSTGVFTGAAASTEVGGTTVVGELTMIGSSVERQCPDAASASSCPCTLPAMARYSDSSTESLHWSVDADKDTSRRGRDQGTFECEKRVVCKDGTAHGVQYAVLGTWTFSVSGERARGQSISVQDHTAERQGCAQGACAVKTAVPSSSNTALKNAKLVSAGRPSQSRSHSICSEHDHTHRVPHSVTSGKRASHRCF